MVKSRKSQVGTHGSCVRGSAIQRLNDSSNTKTPISRLVDSPIHQIKKLRNQLLNLFWHTFCYYKVALIPTNQRINR